MMTSPTPSTATATGRTTVPAPRYVAVVGSRSFRDYARLARELGRARAAWGDFTIITGGAEGADKLAEHYAHVHRLPVQVIKPDWRKFGNRAGLIRNRAIIQAADVVVAYWDGESRGTKHTLDVAAQKGVRAYVRRF